MRVSRSSTRNDPPSGKGTAVAAFRRAIGRQADRARNGGRQLFSAAGGKLRPRGSAKHIPGFASRNKRAAARRPPLRSGRCRERSAVRVRSARRQVIAVKAAHAAEFQEGASP
jgi:hypothetical protein